MVLSKLHPFFLGKFATTSVMKIYKTRQELQTLVKHHNSCDILSMTSIGLLQKKKTGRRGGWLKTYLFENPLGIFRFFSFTPGNSIQNKAPRIKIPNNFVRLLGNSKGKNHDLSKFHYFFSVTLGNCTSFLINPWKFHMLFLWYPLEIPTPQLPCLDFFWTTPL